MALPVHTDFFFALEQENVFTSDLQRHVVVPAAEWNLCGALRLVAESPGRGALFIIDGTEKTHAVEDGVSEDSTNMSCFESVVHDNKTLTERFSFELESGQTVEVFRVRPFKPNDKPDELRVSHVRIVPTVARLDTNGFVDLGYAANKVIKIANVHDSVDGVRAIKHQVSGRWILVDIKQGEEAFDQKTNGSMTVMGEVNNSSQLYCIYKTKTLRPGWKPQTVANKSATTAVTMGNSSSCSAAAIAVKGPGTPPSISLESKVKEATSNQSRILSRKKSSGTSSDDLSYYFKPFADLLPPGSDKQDVQAMTDDECKQYLGRIIETSGKLKDVLRAIVARFPITDVKEAINNEVDSHKKRNGQTTNTPTMSQKSQPMGRPMKAKNSGRAHVPTKSRNHPPIPPFNEGDINRKVPKPMNTQAPPPPPPIPVQSNTCPGYPVDKICQYIDSQARNHPTATSAIVVLSDTKEDGEELEACFQKKGHRSIFLQGGLLTERRYALCLQTYRVLVMNPQNVINVGSNQLTSVSSFVEPIPMQASEGLTRLRILHNDAGLTKWLFMDRHSVQSY